MKARTQSPCQWLAALALGCLLSTPALPAQTSSTRTVTPQVAAESDPATDREIARLTKLYGDFEWLEGAVVGVIDGDTLDIKVSPRKTERIRLIEIDAPERGAPYSQKAKELLSDLTFGQEVGVAVTTWDRDGRGVGRVYAPGDADLVDVSREMVAKGGAWYFDQFGKDRGLLLVQAEARKQRLGLWSLPENQRVPPWEWRKMPKAERDKHR